MHRDDAPALVDPGTVMLDLVLDEGAPAWSGPQVVACREGGMQPQQVQGHWQVGVHRLDAIVLALAAAAGRAVPAEVNGRLPAPRSFGLQVLVAEDNPINQAILRDQLEQLGCRAVVASDGNEALGYWQQGAFALVLTDLNMPGMDGYGLARALRARGVSVPIHGATANADPAERQRCQESGMQGVLVATGAHVGGFIAGVVLQKPLLLWRYRRGELDMTAVMVISNHPELAEARTRLAAL